MATERDWNAHYASGQMPWDSGAPDEHLVRFVGSGGVAPGRALDVGCGTGTNAVWLAEQGFSVLGVDLAPLAIEAANRRLAGRSLDCRFEIRDVLVAPPLDARFVFVFDRGCLHVFDDAPTRARFVARVAGSLVPGGLWLSLLGSTEGPARDVGPPRRNAREILEAVEPELEVVELRSIEFDTEAERPPKAWFGLFRRRSIPAQPSSRLA